MAPRGADRYPYICVVIVNSRPKENHPLASWLVVDKFGFALQSERVSAAFLDIGESRGEIELE